MARTIMDPPRHNNYPLSTKFLVVLFVGVCAQAIRINYSPIHTFATDAEEKIERDFVPISISTSTTATTVVSTSSKETKKTIRPITDNNEIKQHQIENYRSGNALLLNLHPTHHAGTSFCGIIGRTGGPIASKEYPKVAPSFACWQDKDNVVSGDKNSFAYPFHTKRVFLTSTPVSHDETGTYIQSILSHFHMTSWEYDGVDEMQRKVSDTDWEHPNLVSVVITREPLSRLLAGGTMLKKKYPGYNKNTLSHAGWWDYASNPKVQQTDNFFFRIVEGTKRNTTNRGEILRKPKTDNKNKFIYTEDNLPSLESLRDSFVLEQRHYDNAVAILNRFTVVLDIACLDDGFAALGDLLGLNTTAVDLRRQKSNEKREAKADRRTPTMKQSTKERIGFDDVYEYLVEKHKWDTKLYEYSKSISLVDCNT